MVVLIVLIILLSIILLVLTILYIKKTDNFNKMSLDLNENKKHLEQLNKLRDSMLEITQAVVGTDNPNDLYDMILNKAITAIPNANVGSVLTLRDNGLFMCSAHRGFDNDKIKQLAIPLEETFISKFTRGNIQKTEIINDLSSIKDLEIFPITVDSEEWRIQSSITVPLFIENKVIGILDIDSKEKNAFTHNDWTSMEYIRGNIEVALQKHMLYTRTLTLSRFDTLTGVNNRAYFMEQFIQVLNNSERYLRSFTIIIFDINDLKKTNDINGHLAGDRLIQKFAGITSKNIRKTDIFARWGGDEFLGLFHDIKEEEIVEKIENIIEDLKKNPITIENKKIFCQFSFGYSTYPEDGKTFDKLLKIADQKMYANKKDMKESE